MITGILIGIVSASAFWVLLFMYMGRNVNRNASRNMEWQDKMTELLESKNIILSNIDNAIRNR